MYNLELKEGLDKIFKKLTKKNTKQLEIIHKKVLEIRENPFHGYKTLRSPLQGFYRVHIDKNFVLIFKINHTEQTIVLYHYDHHDFVYQWLPKIEI